MLWEGLRWVALSGAPMWAVVIWCLDLLVGGGFLAKLLEVFSGP